MASPNRERKGTAEVPNRVKSRRGGRAGVSRALSEHPDRIMEATLSACPHCACVLGSADQPDTHAHDHIELPTISPTVTRIKTISEGAIANILSRAGAPLLAAAAPIADAVRASPVVGSDETSAGNR